MDIRIHLGVVAFFGVMLLIALWPTDRTAAKVLRKWHVVDPTPAQVAESKVHLKRRRLLYPWLFLGFGYLTAEVLPDGEGYFPPQVLLTLLAGMLTAELISAWRPAKGVLRVAVLAPRRVTDVVPSWGLVVFGADAVAVVALLATSRRPVLVPGLAALVACVLAVVGAVWLAVRRPTSGDDAVDAALRVRSGRVALGLGLAMTGMLAAAASFSGFVMLGLVILPIGLGWNLVTPPVRTEMPSWG